MAEVVAENLATNPSFEEASGEAVVRENLFADYDASALGLVNGQAKWGRSDYANWVLALDGEGGVTLTNNTGGTIPGKEGGIRFSNWGASSLPVQASTAYTFSADFTGAGVSGTDFELRAYWYTSSGSGASPSSTDTPFVVDGGRITATATSPNNAAFAVFRIDPATGIADASVASFSRPLLTVGSVVGDPFGPTTPASGDFTYRARPGGGAQEVAQGVAGFSNAYQSQEWAVSGTHSLRVLSDEFTTTFTVPGTSADTYTVAVTPRHDDQAVSVGGSGISFTVAGEQVRETVAGGSEVSLTARLNPDHVAYVGDGWWDDLLIVEGDYTGSYFDGSTPNTATHKYVWTGQPNASTSQALLVTASDFNLPPGENIRSTLARYIWFGNQRVQQWLPMPSSGTQASYEYAVGGGGLANGGFHARRSSGFHKTYQFDFAVREADQWNGIEGYNRFASGIDSGVSSTGGTGSGISEGTLFRFCDPMVMGRNMFTPQWAAPQLCGEYGDAFHNISGKRGDTYVTPQNTRHYPGTAPYWDLSASGTPSATRQPDDRPRHTFKLLVPPTHMLYLGFVGVITGAGAIFVEKRFRDGTSGVETIAELINPTSGEGLGSLMVDGSEVAYVTMWLGSTSPGDDAQVALVASTAIELPYWETPDMTTGGWWTEGLGHSGLEFGDGAFVETYEVAVQGGRGRYLKGMSTSLVEVGAWR